MGRRHSIAARKASWDAKKSQTYAKISKLIQIAAKKWADPHMNPALELALSKAKQYNLPKDVVEKAILKWSWQLEWEQLEEVFYEWYGPAGVALLIKVLTSNTNRSATNVKHILQKHWGSLWAIGSVAWQFKEQGVFVVNGISQYVQEKGKTVEKISPLNFEEFEIYALQLPITDLEIESSSAVLYCEKKDFAWVQQQLQHNHYHTLEASIQFLPENTISLSPADQEQLYTLLDALEDDEDVDYVWHNARLE